MKTTIAMLMATISFLLYLPIVSASDIATNQPPSSWTPSGSVKVSFADKYLGSCGAIFYNRPVM
jgi:hypothetical protein